VSVRRVRGRRLDRHRLDLLGFALAYTGRGDVVDGPRFGAFTAFGVVTSLLVATNPLHGVFWTGFRLVPVFGAATVSYALQPLAYLTIAVSALPPGLALLVWAGGVGPVSRP
jgi:hypothetical protein